jgi:hypothetical protein
VIDDADALRDSLLTVAHDAVRSALRRGLDPLLVHDAIVDGWLDAHPDLEIVDQADVCPAGAVVADQTFAPEPSRGVESLAFVVHGTLGSRAAGIILRFPGEYPDSFEAVGVRDPHVSSTPAAIRLAFYA